MKIVSLLEGTNMPVDPLSKVIEAPAIRRGENADSQKRKKPKAQNDEKDKGDSEKSSLIDIKV
jgi:hypothetical protein